MKVSDYTDIIIFNSVYVLGTLVAAIYLQNIEFAAYALIVVLLAILVLIAHKRVIYPRWILWGLSLWGLFHLLGGLAPAPPGWPVNGTDAVFYNMWFVPGYIKYDHIIHAYGFGLVTWIIWHGLQVASKNKLRPTFGILVICATAGMGFGAINEIIEFLMTVYVPETNVGGYVNNSLDLISNAVGAMIAAFLIRYSQ